MIDQDTFERLTNEQKKIASILVIETEETGKPDFKLIVIQIVSQMLEYNELKLEVEKIRADMEDLKRAHMVFAEESIK